MNASGHGSADRDRFLGIGYAVLTALLFAGSDALIKRSVAAAPAVLVLWLRYLFQVALLAGWLVAVRRPVAMRVGSWRLQGIRCALLAASSVTGYLSLGQLPLAEHTALMMLAPVISVVMGKFILNESVSRSQWLCVAVGLLGMLVVVRPDRPTGGAYVLLPLSSACFYAGFQMTSKKVMQMADIVTSSLLSAVFISACAGLLLWVQPVDWTGATNGLNSQWGVELLMMCGIATAGQMTLAASLKKASLSVTASFAYLQILFAAAIGLLFFDHWPTLMTLAGSAMIALGGMGSAWLSGYRQIRPSCQQIPT